MSKNGKKSEESNSGRWVLMLIFLPFILIPLAKCVDERNGAPKSVNPFDPAISAATNREMERLDHKNLSEEEFKAASERAFMRELNSRKEQ
ncbi:hypothetical protein [Pseudomonas kuykendallii]|uniref:hypothetical protein n=1 Tax=Pseudomonas kuykendallii TaxID=1007099 RepID=UPI0028A20979|nr:hypothetical protein [Pseudomonas kuykendallii]